MAYVTTSSKEIVTLLCSFFTFSSNKGELPLSYKEANVTPVHKTDDPATVNDYHPITIKHRENMPL